jgi:hypothetical protein
MRRHFALVGLALASVIVLAGCAKEAQDPGEILAEEKARALRPSYGSGAKVTCRCDAEGGLHVGAPQGSRVTAHGPDGDAEAEIILPAQEAAQPIRRTISLGFVGDGPLTQTLSHGGPWNAPDAVLPPHTHSSGRYGSGYGYYGGYGYGGHGYGGYTTYGRGIPTRR